MTAHARIPSVASLRWSIKIAAPLRRRFWWGDFHFAGGLAKALRALGQEVEIDPVEAWYKPSASLDDVVLVLRGLERYRPGPDHVNLQWVISHPDDITEEEWGEFDHSFVASARTPRARRTRSPVEQLLQATDTGRFKVGASEPELGHDVLFVGNSRWRMRPVVQAALAADLPLSVYGDGWAGLLPDDVLRGERIPNRTLARYYRSAGVMLNDHWEDMRREAFLSNRLFDAAACGARVVSDPIDGLDEVFGGVVSTYGRPKDLGALVRRILAQPGADQGPRLELARHIRDEHSFAVRARRLVSVAQELTIERRTKTYRDGQPVR